MSTQPKTCADCGQPLSRRNRTGRCKRHVTAYNMSNPDTRAKLAETKRRMFAADPVLKARQAAYARAASSSPRGRAAARANLVRTKAWLAGNAAQPAGSEPRRRAARNSALTKLAWCPPHLRDQYRALRKSKDMKAAEARRMILEQHELEMRRWRRSVGVDVPRDVVTHPEQPFFDRASAVAASWAGVEDIWVKAKAGRIKTARWAVFLALRRGGLSLSAIGRQTGMERSAVTYALERAEVLAATPSSEFAEVYALVVAA